MKGRCIIIAVAVLAVSSASGFSLDYDSPAGTWNEALPIGNGRLGAMVFGGPGMERLQLNEDTLWAGGPNYALEPRMRGFIPESRRRILAGDADDAYNWFKAKNIRTSKNGTSFAYQTIGSLCMKFAGQDFPQRYRRSLSLEDAVVRTEYCVDGVTFSREAFASLADDVIVVRVKASKPGAVTFTAFFESPWQRFAQSTDDGSSLTLAGRGSSVHGTEGCVRFRVRLKPTVKGGKVRADNGVLFVEGADEAVLWCSAATSFRNWQDGSSVDESSKAERLLEGAMALGADEAMRRHVAAYGAQFNRCRVELGPDPTPGRTVPERLASFKGKGDPYLAALYFALGRYLLIASSQPGTQPPTLQGIWNEWLDPPWKSSYTININLEMNYWPVDVANLPDLIEPLLRALEESAVSGARTAKDNGAGAWSWRAVADGRGVAHHAAVGALAVHARQGVPRARLSGDEGRGGVLPRRARGGSEDGEPHRRSRRVAGEHAIDPSSTVEPLDARGVVRRADTPRPLRRRAGGREGAWARDGGRGRAEGCRGEAAAS